MAREIRDLIRQMSSANPLWCAPRIHGELLNLGIEIGQAAVAKYMLRRRGAPSPTWRTFLRNHAEGIAAIDMFVVAPASFRLLYVMILLAHDRRNIELPGDFETLSKPSVVIVSGVLVSRGFESPFSSFSRSTQEVRVALLDPYPNCGLNGAASTYTRTSVAFLRDFMRDLQASR